MATALGLLWLVSRPTPCKRLKEEDRRAIMATDMILPVLGMAQDTGKIVQWLKREGQPVKKGEPVVEVETDKATVELEAPADGVLANVTATEDHKLPAAPFIAPLLPPVQAYLYR